MVPCGSLHLRRLSVLAFLALGVFQGPTRAEDLDDQLLKAELLEVSAGDLSKAIEVYQSIQADEKAPARLRSRALLNLGRCQRKLGEFDGAKRTLEDLVRRYPEEREAVRQAQSFLRELQGGKAENPRFDWLKELEKSPEIQARVFDLCMDLASSEDTKVATARRQLKALGSVAVPVMERVLEVSRDEGQKRELGMTLLKCGSYERLGMFLDPSQPPDWKKETTVLRDFAASIPKLPEASRKDLLTALGRITDSRLSSPVAFLKLLAGDRNDLKTKLETIAPLAADLDSNSTLERIWQPLMTQLAKVDGAVHDLIAARIVEPDCPAPLRQAHVKTLESSFPAELTPSVRAKISRAGKDIQGLYVMAQGSDEAVPELLDLLRHRAEEAPDFRPERWSGNRQNFNQWTAQFPKTWPSSALVTAMASLLGSSDVITLSIALETLSLTKMKLEPAVIDQVEKLAKESTDPDLREFALIVLLNNVALDRETAPRAAAALFGEFRRRLAAEDEEPEPTASPLVALNVWARGSRQNYNRQVPLPPVPGRRIPSRPRQPATSPLPEFAWLSQSVEHLRSLDESAESLKLIYQSALPLSDSEDGARFHAWLADWGIIDKATLAAFLPRVQSDALAQQVASILLQPTPGHLDRPETPATTFDFLAGVARNNRLPIAIRLKVCYLAPDEIYARWDWPTLMREDEELADALLRGRVLDKSASVENSTYREHFWNWFQTRSDDAKASFFAAGISSPNDSIRGNVVRRYPLEGQSTPATLRKLLQDPSEFVRHQAATRLSATTRADVAPLYLDMLQMPDTWARKEALRRLPEFASAESIEPLSKLLDDPDVSVRGEALEALKKIKAALAERQEWKELAEKLKSVPKSQ